MISNLTKCSGKPQVDNSHTSPDIYNVTDTFCLSDARVRFSAPRSRAQPSGSVALGHHHLFDSATDCTRTTPARMLTIWNMKKDSAAEGKYSSSFPDFFYYAQLMTATKKTKLSAA